MSGELVMSRPRGESSVPSVDLGMPITREIVELSHLLILGRLPKTEHQIMKGMECGTLSLLRQSLLNSKTLEAQQKRAAKRPFLFFIHIPKAAGTFVKAYFSTVYGTDRCAWLTKKKAISGDPNQSKFSVAGGHVPFDDIPAHFIDRDPTFLSIIRHPTARVVSYYNFLRTQIDHPSHDRIQKFTLFEAITNDIRFKNQCDRDQIRFLSGAKDINSLSRIMEKNPFIIGKQERLDGFMGALHEQLRLPIVSADYRRANAATPGYLADIAAQPRYEEAIEIITRLNEDEFKLYNSFETVWTNARGRHRVAKKTEDGPAAAGHASTISPISKPTPEIVALAHQIIFGKSATKRQIAKGVRCGTISLMREALLNSEQFESPAKKAAGRPFLFFIHIPKTAGGSLRKYFKTAFGAACQWYLRNLNVEDRPVMRRDAPFDVARHLARYRITGGHIQFDDIPLTLLEQKPIFISVIRNPVQRILSYYNYVRTEESHPGRERMLELTLYEALTKDRRFAAQCDRGQIRFLCGRTDLETLHEVLGKHQFLIGKQEFMDDFMAALHEKLDLPLILASAKQIHKSAPDYVTQIASQPNYDAAIEIITAQNADEFAFYNSFGSIWCNLRRAPEVPDIL